MVRRKSYEISKKLQQYRRILSSPRPETCKFTKATVSTLNRIDSLACHQESDCHLRSKQVWMVFKIGEDIAPVVKRLRTRNDKDIYAIFSVFTCHICMFICLFVVFRLYREFTSVAERLEVGLTTTVLTIRSVAIVIWTPDLVHESRFLWQTVKLKACKIFLGMKNFQRQGSLDIFFCISKKIICFILTIFLNTLRKRMKKRWNSSTT